MPQQTKATTTVNLRRREQPNTSAVTLEILPPGREVQSIATVVGEVVRGNNLWLQVLPVGFVWAGGMRFEAASPPGEPFGFVQRAAARATEEWAFFGKQMKNEGGKTTQKGRQEDEQPDWAARVGAYWLEGTNTHGLDGTNRESPWSAAFISWIMKNAGAGSGFRYSTQHSVYISQAIRDRNKGRQEAGYWGFRLPEEKPKVGDLVCWTRDGAQIDYDHQAGGDYKSHTDLVVDVDNKFAWIIGGNVGQSVTRRPVPLTSGGFLGNAVVGGEVLFALMRCRIA